jgi:hypothetical protein
MPLRLVREPQSRLRCVVDGCALGAAASGSFTGSGKLTAGPG